MEAAPGSTTKMMVLSFEDKFMEAKKSRQKMNATVDEVSDFTDAKTQPESQGETCIWKTVKHSAMMNDESVLSAVSPQSEETHLTSLGNAKKQPLVTMNAD